VESTDLMQPVQIFEKCAHLIASFLLSTKLFDVICPPCKYF